MGKKYADKRFNGRIGRVQFILPQISIARSKFVIVRQMKMLMQETP